MMDDPVIIVGMFLILLITPAIGVYMYFNKKQQEEFDQWNADQERYAAEAKARDMIRAERRANIYTVSTSYQPQASFTPSLPTSRNSPPSTTSTFDNSYDVLTSMMISESLRNDNDTVSGTVSWIDDTPNVAPTVEVAPTSSYSSSYSSSSDSTSSYSSSYSSSSSDSSYSSSSDSSSSSYSSD